MACGEFLGQGCNVTLLGIGIIIIFLIYLIRRVNAIARLVEDYGKNVQTSTEAKAEAPKPVYAPVREAPALAAVPGKVPNAVIVAIGAAVNQYRIDNN